MGTSGRDEIDVAMAAFMFAEDFEAAPSGGNAWPPGDSSFVSTPTWASLQQEQAGQHNFEQLLQTNLDGLPDFPEFDGALALPEARHNGSREAASTADSDVKPCFKTSTKTRDSNRRAQQKWREKQRAKQQEMEDRLQQLTQQLQNVMAEKAFVEGRNSILQSELLRRNSPDSPLGPISSGQGTGCLLGSGLQQAAVATASRQGSGLQRDSAAGRSGGLSMASSEELSGQTGEDDLPNVCLPAERSGPVRPPQSRCSASVPLDTPVMITVDPEHEERLLASDVLELSWEKYAKMHKAYINAFAALLVEREGSDSAAQAADRRLMQLTGEMSMICQITHTSNGVVSRQLHCRKLDDSAAMQDTSMDTWRHIVGLLELTPQQKQQLMAMRHFYFTQQARILRHRRKIREALQASRHMGVLLLFLAVGEGEQEHDLTGVADYLTTAQAVEQLQHNLETDHCLLCDFMSIAYKQVFSYVQVAKACVHSYPWTPDMITMLESVAEDEKEPLAAELLGQPQLQRPVVYDPSGQRRWIDQDIMTHDSKEGI
eukprot:jgi/Astpho2/10014/Aster-x0883